MAAVTIRELLTRLGVDADTAAVKDYDKALGMAKSTMLAASAAAAALGAALVGAAVLTARQGDEAAKAAARVGINAQEMQELGFAAEQAGASLKDVETAFRRQARAAVDAAEEVGPAADTYRKLKINVREAGGAFKKPLALFLETTDAIRGMATETEKSAAANDLFGRGGAKILPLINAGADGINALRQQAHDLGYVLDAEATKAAEEFTDRMNEARLAVTGVRNQIGKRMIPVLTEMLEGFRDFVIVNRAVIRQAIERNMDKITKAINFVRDAVRRADKVVRERMGGWGNIILQIEKVGKFTALVTGLGVVIKLAQAAKIAFAGMSLAGGPVTIAIVALTAAVVIAALALDDLITFANGGESAIGAFLDKFDPALAEEFRATLNSLNAEFSVFISTVEEALSVFGPFDELVGDFFRGASFAGKSLTLVFIERMNDEVQVLVGWLKIAAELVKLVSGGDSDVIGTINTERRQLVDRARERGEEQAASIIAGQRAAAPLPGVSFGTPGSASIVNQGGDQITMNISGTSEAEMVSMMDRLRTNRNRRAMAASVGGER